jgi:ABC-type branched-subunit amino acid transport system ATPase component
MTGQLVEDERSPASAAESGQGLIADGVRREFGGVVAIDDVSFEVSAGEIVGLVGPNGAGKSTFLAVVAGAIRATSGRILFHGTDVTRWPEHKVARHGLVRTSQLSSEFQKLTVLENLLVAAPGQRGEGFRSAVLPPRFWRDQEAQLIDEALGILDEFGMLAKANDYASTLSGGQKRLLELMRVLMVHPKMILLDEPMAGINPGFIGTVEAVLLDIRARGVDLVIAEHELDVIERLCDRVVVMAQGRVLARGSMDELRARPEVVEAYLVG